ncbi:hypothetical protein A2661_00775 [Candidatus Giovannonibacteria bacterium RIFCSPHIGHO2_01_FULL_45_24]|uniref:HTH HARE-type domain-containing protein n=1 Tax=Candidatus Giovannonibacteria bacterium RIFCSPLOWO2_01_FULL_46_32 TaxID=1798353 RepID=A0A1F5XGW1_9BACT|nr:MAG: hypothetical protein A2661_00775 [Candidatus Giovannonibacteria bacterium RIFCSPHIGHO2_01_FULL_45_24]OGF87110.1 MAG: hypothetical protein A3B19_01615 [Candidatus Giovannonibacteria bacterium RIFCSPLOWO2_01_FULL_46_32]
MNRSPKVIMAGIKELVAELEASLGVQPSRASLKPSRGVAARSVPKGAFGAVSMLIEEGFFDAPKEISTIMDKLKQVGHYHTPPAVAMNLLNLTKRRILNRFKNKETKNWEYVIRK